MTMSPRPTAAQYRAVNPVYQGLVLGYANADENLIAEKVCPPKNTEGQSSGTIYVISRGDQFGDPTDDLQWHLGTSPHLSAGFGTSTTSFSCHGYADKAGIPRKAKSRSDIPLDLAELHLGTITQNLKIKQELRTSAAFFNASTFTQNTTLAGATQWSAATSDPFTNISVGIETVEAATGRTPNTIIFGRQPWYSFMRNAAVLNFLATDKDRQIISNSDAAALLMQKFDGIKNVHVGRGRYRTTNPNQTLTLADCWGDYVWIGNIDQSDTILSPAAGKVAIKPTAVARFQEEGFTPVEYYNEDTDTDYLRVSHYEDLVVTSASDGYLIIDTTA